MSSHDVHVTSSVHAEHSPSINLAQQQVDHFPILKTSHPTGQPAHSKKEYFQLSFGALVRALYPANAMARPLACRSPCQNAPPTGKDKPTGLVPTEGSDIYTPAPAVSRAPTSAPPAAPALALAAVNSTVR